jgi:hypothetical protein
VTPRSLPALASAGAFAPPSELGRVHSFVDTVRLGPYASRSYREYRQKTLAAKPICVYPAAPRWLTRWTTSSR